MFFKHFASENQLPVFYINRTLAENGLITEISGKDLAKRAAVMDKDENSLLSCRFQKFRKRIK